MPTQPATYLKAIVAALCGAFLPTIIGLLAAVSLSYGYKIGDVAQASMVSALSLLAVYFTPNSAPQPSSAELQARIAELEAQLPRPAAIPAVPTPAAAILLLIVAGMLLSGCGLPVLFTGVAEGPNGRTNAGAGLASFTPPPDPKLCSAANFQGAVNAASFSGSCKVGADGSREESFQLTGADSGSILEKVLEAQTKQNADNGAALNQALGTLATVAGPAVKGALAGATGGTSLLLPPLAAAPSPAPPLALGLNDGSALSPRLGQPQS